MTWEEQQDPTNRLPKDPWRKGQRDRPVFLFLDWRNFLAVSCENLKVMDPTIETVEFPDDFLLGRHLDQFDLIAFGPVAGDDRIPIG